MSTQDLMEADNSKHPRKCITSESNIPTFNTILDEQWNKNLVQRGSHSSMVQNSNNTNEIESTRDNQGTSITDVGRHREIVSISQETTFYQTSGVTHISNDEELKQPDPNVSLLNREPAGRAVGRRIRGTREMNIQIMRSFYYVDQSQDTPLPGWRSSLYKKY